MAGDPVPAAAPPASPSLGGVVIRLLLIAVETLLEIIGEVERMGFMPLHRHKYRSSWIVAGPEWGVEVFKKHENSH